MELVLIALPLALSIGIVHSLVHDWLDSRQEQQAKNTKMVAARYRRIVRFNRPS